jgi:type I restriction enzyme S subunit
MVSPTVEEQLMLVKASSAIDERLEIETRHSESLMELKSGLMDDLLTGRVRVTPLLEDTNQGSA